MAILTAARGVIASADMANVLSDEKKQQVIALGRLGGAVRLIILDNRRDGVLVPDIYDPIGI
jgi:hypothetical protein